MEGVAERVFLFAEKLCSWVIERRRDGAEGFREKYKYEVFLQEMNSDGHRCRKVSRQDIRSHRGLNNFKRKERDCAGKSKIRKEEQRKDVKAVVSGKFPEPRDKRGIL